MTRYRISKPLSDAHYTVYDESDSVAAVVADLPMAQAIAEAGNLGLLRLRVRKLIDHVKLDGLDARSKNVDQLLTGIQLVMEET